MPELEGPERDAWVDGFATAAADFALAAGREANRRFWDGYATGLVDGGKRVRRGQSRGCRVRSLTRPDGRAVAR